MKFNTMNLISLTFVVELVNCTCKCHSVCLSRWMLYWRLAGSVLLTLVSGSSVNTLGTGYLNCLYAYKCKSASSVLNVLRFYNIPVKITTLMGLQANSYSVSQFMWCPLCRIKDSCKVGKDTCA
jgi:hypothetical protein